MRAPSAARLLFVPVGLAALAVVAFAKDKAPEPARGENSAVSLVATVHTAPADYAQLLGVDIGPYYTVVELTVTPKHGKVKVDPDDFLLRSYRDGEHTKPLAISEITGSPDMVVHQANVGPSEANGGATGPIWMAGPVMGGGAGVAHPNVMTASVSKDKDKEKDKSEANARVAAALKQKLLPEGEIEQPVTGYLIFNLEKQRLKDLQLEYAAPEGPIKVKFK